LQYGAIRFARHKKHFLARFSHYAPSNDLFGAIHHLRATIPPIGAILSQSGGENEIFPSPPLGTPAGPLSHNYGGDVGNIFHRGLRARQNPG
jgi:hypothetical protein